MANGECPFYTSIRAVLELPVSDKERRAHLKKLGVENTLLNAIHLELGEKAASGDVQAAKYLRDTALAQSCDKENTAVQLAELDLSELSDDALRAIAAQVAEET